MPVRNIVWVIPELFAGLRGYFLASFGAANVFGNPTGHYRT